MAKPLGKAIEIPAKPRLGFGQLPEISKRNKLQGPDIDFNRPPFTAKQFEVPKFEYEPHPLLDKKDAFAKPTEEATNTNVPKHFGEDGTHPSVSELLKYQLLQTSFQEKTELESTSTSTGGGGSEIIATLQSLQSQLKALSASISKAGGPESTTATREQYVWTPVHESE